MRSFIAVLLLSVALVGCSAPSGNNQATEQARSFNAMATALATAYPPMVTSAAKPIPTPFQNNVLITPAASGTKVVIYNVDGLDGATRASLTYTNEQGGTEQVEVTLPWRKALSVPRGQFVYVSAQNKDAAGGVSCDIRVDMQLFKHSESRGAYVIASCSGSTP